MLDLLISEYLKEAACLDPCVLGFRGGEDIVVI